MGLYYLMASQFVINGILKHLFGWHRNECTFWMNFDVGHLTAAWSSNLISAAGDGFILTLAVSMYFTCKYCLVR